MTEARQPSAKGMGKKVKSDGKGIEYPPYAPQYHAAGHASYPNPYPQPMGSQQWHRHR